MLLQEATQLGTVRSTLDLLIAHRENDFITVPHTPHPSGTRALPAGLASMYVVYEAVIHNQLAVVGGEGSVFIHVILIHVILADDTVCCGAGLVARPQG